MFWETEVPTGEEIRFFPLFFSKKTARSFARRLHEGESQSYALLMSDISQTDLDVLVNSSH